MMIASEKSYQNLSDINQFSFKNRFEVNKKQIFSSEKRKNSAHSFSAQAFISNALYWRLIDIYLVIRIFINAGKTIRLLI